MDSNITSSKGFHPETHNTAKVREKRGMEGTNESVAHNTKADGIAPPASVTNKKILNAAILESALKFEGNIGNQPQALLLKTALEGINEALKALGVEKTVEQSAEEGLDVSPEATADRIVAFSTNFFSSYAEQHPELDEQQALTKFVEVISGGIDEGFSEAKEVLTGLNVLEGDIEKNIDKTYDLVQKGLADFIEKNSSEKESLVE